MRRRGKPGPPDSADLHPAGDAGSLRIHFMLRLDISRRKFRGGAPRERITSPETIGETYSAMFTVPEFVRDRLSPW